MKKLLIAGAMLASVVCASEVGLVRAAPPGPTITWNGSSATPRSLPDATVGSFFEFVNNGTFLMLVNASGSVSVGGQTCLPHMCYVAPSSPEIVEVTGLGTIAIQDGEENVLATITLGGGSTKRSTTWAVTFDPNGGVCNDNAEPWTIKFKDTFVLGSRLDCTRAGYRLAGWTRDREQTADSDLLTILVARSGRLTAVWRPIEPPAPPAGATILVNWQCGPCSSADVWWFPSSTTGVTYDVVLSALGDTGTYAPISTTSVASAPRALIDQAFSLVGLTSGTKYRVEIFSVLEGVRSTSAALVLPVAQSSSTSSSDESSTVSSNPSPYADFVLAGAPNQCSITIVGGRGTVSGKPGISVDGVVTGLATGAKLKPWVKFPGQTSYAEGSARPQVDGAGKFSWQRKTGKKAYVYFTTEDGNCRSNSVIIPAN